MELQSNRFVSLILTAAFLLSTSAVVFPIGPDKGMYTPDQIARLPLH